jgi:hypothetical protein
MFLQAAEIAGHVVDETRHIDIAGSKHEAGIWILRQRQQHVLQRNFPMTLRAGVSNGAR